MANLVSSGAITDSIDGDDISIAPKSDFPVRTNAFARIGTLKKSFLEQIRDAQAVGSLPLNLPPTEYPLIIGPENRQYHLRAHSTINHVPRGSTSTVPFSSASFQGILVPKMVSSGHVAGAVCSTMLKLHPPRGSISSSATVLPKTAKCRRRLLRASEKSQSMSL